MFHQEFDVVIIDEATQAVEAVGSGFVGMTIGEMITVIGLLDSYLQGEEVDTGWGSNATSAYHSFH